jgi:hypothetical protein
MRKHLFSFIAAVGVLFAGAGTAWADDVQMGLTIPNLTSDTKFTVNPTSEVTGITVTQSNGTISAGGTGTSTSKDIYFGASVTKVIQTLTYKSMSTAKSATAYIGFVITIADGYELDLSKVDAAVGVGADGYCWQVELLDKNESVVYTSAQYTISSKGSTDNKTLSSTLSLSKLKGTVSARLYTWNTAGTGSKYLAVSKFLLTGTVKEEPHVCEDVTFTQAPQFDFAKKAYVVSLASETNQSTIYYTTSAVENASLDNEYTTSIPISAEGTEIKAIATRDGYDSSNTTTSGVLKAPASYDADKKYVAWVYENGYKDKVTYDYTTDPLYEALAADYNVVPVNFSSKSVTWSDECPTLNQADVIVITEAITGNGTLSISLKDLAGTVPMVNMKAYSYGSDRWNWGATAAPATATGVITPSYTNYKLFDGVTFDDDGKTITLANEGSSNAMVQTVSDLGNAVPGLPITIAKCGDGIAIYASDNYLLYALSCNSFTYYNENAATILKNAVNRLATGESLTEMGEGTVCVDPIATFSAIDMSTYTYLLTLTVTDNSAIYYTRADGVKTLYTEPISLKRKEVITVIAEAEGKTSSNEITVTAPDLSGSGSETAEASSGGDWTGACFLIPSAANAGSTSALTGAKLRVNQTLASTSDKGFTINVSTGYIINKVEMTCISNYTTGLNIKQIYVDGEATDYKNLTIEKSSGTKHTYTLYTNAKSTIEIATNYKSGATETDGTTIDGNSADVQANFAFKFYYTIPEDPTILHTVTFSDAVEGYATFCPAKNVLIPEGVTAYIAKAENNALTLSEIKVCIPANTGVILKGTAGETAEFETTGFTADVTGNELTGVTKETTIEAKSVYVLSAEGEEGVGFFVFSGTTIPANKAYYKAPAASTISALHFNFGETEEPGNVTGINAVAIENNAQQVIYDLRGRRVQSLDRPGLYIVNGKKVAIQ